MFRRCRNIILLMTVMMILCLSCTGDAIAQGGFTTPLWVALPPYNVMWPLWSPALSPISPITGLTTPLLTSLTRNTVLPVQPGLGGRAPLRVVSRQGRLARRRHGRRAAARRFLRADRRPQLDPAPTAGRPARGPLGLGRRLPRAAVCRRHPRLPTPRGRGHDRHVLSGRAGFRAVGLSTRPLLPGIGPHYSRPSAWTAA